MSDELENELKSRYLHLRRALITLFECSGCDSPDDLADETIFRIVKSIRDGKAIQNLAAWAHGVASKVLKEHVRRCIHERQVAVETRLLTPSSPTETLSGRLEEAIRQLPDADRALLEGYHGGEAEGLIARRHKLARRLRIKPETLRSRVFRIRSKLLAMLSEPDDDQKEGETHSTTVHS